MPIKRHKLCREPRTGIYYARIQVNGIRRRFAFGKSRKPAEAALRRLERDIASGAVPFDEKPKISGLDLRPADDMLLSKLIAAHLEWLAANRADQTLRARKHYARAFLDFHGDCMVSTISRIDLERFYAWAKQNRSRGRNGGNVFLRHIKTLLLWGDELGLCRCAVRKFPATPETPPDNRRFTDDEIRKLLACMSEEHEAFKDLIVFAILTGLRPQELRALSREQLMQDAYGDYYIFIQQHKTSRSSHAPVPRSVPLCPEALEIMRRRIAAHPGSPTVFVNAHGRPYTQSGLHGRLRRWCLRAGIPARSPYSLRHTFGSLQAEANINQTSISQIMGHGNIRTASRYIANNADHHKNAISAIASRVKDLL
jgi:integrase